MGNCWSESCVLLFCFWSTQITVADIQVSDNQIRIFKNQVRQILQQYKDNQERMIEYDQNRDIVRQLNFAKQIKQISVVQHKLVSNKSSPKMFGSLAPNNQCKQEINVDNQNKTKTCLDDESFMVVKMVNQNKVVLQTWLIDKSNMQIFYHQKDDIINCNSIYKQILLTSRLHSTPTIPSKSQNYIFIGRCSLPTKSITIDKKCISNKHLIIQKEDDPHRSDLKSIYCFLFCYNKSFKCPFNPLSKLPRYLIKIIVDFVGPMFVRDRFYVFDCMSKNGAMIEVGGGRIGLGEWMGERILVDRRAEVGLICEKIVNNKGISWISLTLDNQLARMRDPTQNQHIAYRNSSLEQSKQYLQVLVICVKTPSKNKLYCLYSQQNTYRLKLSKYDLDIVKDTIQTQNGTNSQVDNEQKMKIMYSGPGCWNLDYPSHHNMYIKMGKQKKYKIDNHANLCLGKQVCLSIQLHNF